ncbi:MAG: hypothetical protein KDE55_10510 [Novosphingobium sp.]|nr:hypothetical protein [Novosphingobium sp.]
MSTAVFALLLFGCSDDGTVCQKLETPAQTYEVRAECIADQPVALQSDAAMAADAPSVYAQCLNERQVALIGNGEIDLRAVARRTAMAVNAR